MGAGRVNWLFDHPDSSLESDLGSSRLISCSTVPQKPHIRSPLRAADTKIPRTRGIGLGRMRPIFTAASCSQDVIRPTHQDPTRKPRGCCDCDDRSDCADTMRPSTRRPPEPRPGQSARAVKKPPIADDTLREMAPLFTATWLSDVLPKALGLSRPALHNSDGDEVVCYWTHCR
jgi:hypothetical protein